MTGAGDSLSFSGTALYWEPLISKCFEYMNMTITQFTEQLAKANTPSQINKLLSQYLNSFGIKSYAFTYYSGHTKTTQKLIYDISSKPLKLWHKHYLAQDYADVDRTLEHSHQITLPIFWDVHEQLAHAKNRREKRIREESIEFGIDKGLSLPIHGPQHDFIILVLHQRINETGLKHYQKNQFEWLAAAFYYYHHLKKVLPKQNHKTQLFKLTYREQQCLMMTADDMRVERIAEALNITERTVHFHLQNANKKLGTKNKYQAVNKWINLHPDVA